MPDIANNRIQLSLINGSAHEVGQEHTLYDNTSFPRSEQVLEAQKRGEMRARLYSEYDTGPLVREAKKSREARIELHQRLALPFACLALALAAVPLGVSSRKSGKSAAVVLTVGLAFLYYMALISLNPLARQGTLPVEVAVWAPNTLFLIAGIVLLVRLERPGDRDVVGRLTAAMKRLTDAWRGRRRAVAAAQPVESSRFSLQEAIY